MDVVVFPILNEPVSLRYTRLLAESSKELENWKAALLQPLDFTIHNFYWFFNKVEFIVNVYFHPTLNCNGSSDKYFFRLVRESLRSNIPLFTGKSSNVLFNLFLCHVDTNSGHIKTSSWKRLLYASMSSPFQVKVQSSCSFPLDFRLWAVFSSHHSLYIVPRDLISMARSQSLHISVPPGQSTTLERAMRTSRCIFQKTAFANLKHLLHLFEPNV
ncbi:hypothetical protein Tco_0488884 [Tanacetum coccineum]